MGGIKEFWKHAETGAVYVIESTREGEVLGAAGPLDGENLPEAKACECSGKINVWIKRAFADNKLRRLSTIKNQKLKIKAT